MEIGRNLQDKPGVPKSRYLVLTGTSRIGLRSEELAFIQKNWKFGLTQKIWSQTAPLIFENTGGVVGGLVSLE